MSNLYMIQEELLKLFNDIEENGGELTPEMEEALVVKQEELVSKIKNYTNVIKSLKTDIGAIKEEKARLDAYQKSKEKLIDRLTKIMVEAIDKFGDTSKSGTKFVSWDTGKVSIRKSKAIELDDDQIARFVDKFMSHCNWVKAINQFNWSLLDPEALLQSVNKTDDPALATPDYTMDDLNCLDVKFETTMSIRDMLENEEAFDALKALLMRGFGTVKYQPNISKTALKNLYSDNLPKFAELKENKSITIK